MNLLLYLALCFTLKISFGYINIHEKNVFHSTMTRTAFLAKESSDTSIVKSKKPHKKEKLIKKRKHSMWKALILSFPLLSIPMGGGMLGLHRFYLGYKKTGWIMLILGVLALASVVTALAYPAIILTSIYLPLMVPIIFMLFLWVLIDFSLIGRGRLKFKDGTPLKW